MGKMAKRKLILALSQVCLVLGLGCGDLTSLLNPAFVSTVSGGSFPVTPGPGADFVLVRVVNETAQTAEFIVTIERQVVERDEDGNPLVDEQTGDPITRPVRETVRLDTEVSAPANELGVLFPCGESAIDLIGLGQNLMPTDAAVFVGGGGAGGVPGFGIPASTLNPLSRLTDPSNFNCGDTVIFRAIRSVNEAGGIKLESFLLPGFEQPSVFAGPSTFTNYEDLLESQLREDVP